MRALLFLSVNFLIPYIFSIDVESYEENPEITPIYDIILFNDIAEVIKDFEDGLNSQSDAFAESDSDENIEDLLLEYQHYLDKAHKQRVDHLIKLNGKNKVPLLRHERYPKKKPTMKKHHSDFYKSLPHNFIPSSKLLPHLGPFLPDYMISHNSFNKYSPVDSEALRSNKQSPDMTYNLQKPISEKALLSSCYCKATEIPCKCGCKQCFITTESVPKPKDLFISRGRYLDNTLENHTPKHLSNPNSNDFKIRIKIDIKVPKIIEMLEKFYENTSRDNKMIDSDQLMSKDAAINSLSPYLHLPSPMELFKYSIFPGISNFMPMQSITIRKKKKVRNNNNKKHSKKSLNINILNGDKNVTTVVLNKNNNGSTLVMNDTSLDISNTKIGNVNAMDKKLENVNQSVIGKPIPKVENNHSNEFIYLTLNISNNHDENQTDITRHENSIETGEIKTKGNKTASELNVREKRQIKLNNETRKTTLTSGTSNNFNDTLDKKLENILNDEDLLYWSENNSPLIKNYSKNINTLILNLEKRKTKFNMSKESIRNNHSVALEKAIFGEVNWNDMDTVVPVFISFFGKYVRGVLTFCSDTICHSMKCADKICLHRKCDPINRYNNKGHCVGTNSTDSTAKMESTMDLPSNVAFEIVDILNEKLNAKMFGKMTICIGYKCITFVASKKIVLKSKCTIKELTTTKECPFNKKY
ncbi:integrator complex subunit 1 homolog [Colias croceus]|uniref:integrator complex subunit 1 homolog n=1 Tax=Colias crocea TaxID=72248 RepID=UPI001E27AB83|nr:integrator complex subunit 1 homolog [Colias croceus]